MNKLYLANVTDTLSPMWTYKSITKGNWEKLKRRYKRKGGLPFTRLPHSVRAKNRRRIKNITFLTAIQVFGSDDDGGEVSKSSECRISSVLLIPESSVFLQFTLTLHPDVIYVIDSERKS